MMKITRRAAVGVMAAAPLAMPGIIRAQSTSKPVRIGLLSDMGGPYRDVGGPGNRVAVELAVADARWLGARSADRGAAGRRPEQARRGQCTGARMDRQPGRRCARRRRRFIVRSRDSAGLSREEAHLSDHRTGHVRHDRQAVLAVRHPLRLRHLCAGARHRRLADQGRRRYLVLHHRGLRIRLRAGARHHRGGAGSRRQGAG